MKKLVALLLVSILLLAACNDEAETVELKLTFVDLEKPALVGPYAIYSSEIEELYYKVAISPYQYNNWEKEKGETVTVTKNVNGVLGLTSTSYDAVLDGEDVVLYETVYYYDN
ncbi:hypothetical protein [Viridibacillus arvi]|uniref:hypothetical protein n=1 Tax=Viridibacillus arvi TaxID=263475 RepID=UPI0034CDAB0B